jgi:hypothetical protein
MQKPVHIYRPIDVWKKVQVLADFIPGPSPKIEFKAEGGNEFKSVLKKKVLHGTFRGMIPSGITTSSWIEMEKEPKKYPIGGGLISFQHKSGVQNLGFSVLEGKEK